jgi:hypothetical protein
MKRILFAALVSFILAGCGGTDDADSRSIAGNKYDNPAVGLSLQFPTTWLLQLDHAINGQTVDLFATGPAVAGMTPNVNIGIKAYTGAIDWNQLFPAIHDALQAQFPSLADFQDTVIDLDGVQFGEMKFTMAPNGAPLKLMQDLIFTKGKEIIITYTDGASRFDGNTDLQSIRASMAFK